MGKIKIVLGIAFLLIGGGAAWQIGACEVANMNFQEDLRDMGSQATAHMGTVVPLSDADMNNAVIVKAKEHGIELSPAQVTVRRIGSGERTTFYLAADYTVPVNLGLSSFQMRFSPTSDKP